MAHITANRVYETSTTVLTASYVLLGAKSSVHQACSAAMANNDTGFFCAYDTTNGGWEVFLGTWTTGGILVRTTILASSNANAAVSWSAGTRELIMCSPASQIAALVRGGATGQSLVKTGSGDFAVGWSSASTLQQTDDGTASSSTKTLDVSANYSHKLTVGGAFTLAFSNWAATGNLSSIEIQLINGASSAITWPTINWLKGDGTVSTTFSSMGVTLATSGTNTVIVWTTDGGTTLYGKAA